MKKPYGRTYSAEEVWDYHEDTAGELKFAAALKKAQIPFEKEVPIKQFTVDFLIDDWLIVEVDGWSHLTSFRQAEDTKRQTLLEDTGFTVIRVPTMDISQRPGLKRWVNKIKDLRKQGPPGLGQQGFENLHLKKEVEAARNRLAKEARRAGLAAQERKRQKMWPAKDATKGRSKDARKGTGESMEDYFGPQSEDFEELLNQYDWSKAPKKDEIVNERRFQKKSKKGDFL